VLNQGLSIVRFTPALLSGLGAPHNIAESFFPRELLSEEELSGRYALELETICEFNPISLTLFGGDQVLDLHSETLLPIALFANVPFRVPVVLQSLPGWRVERIRYEPPDTELAPCGPNEEPEERPTVYHSLPLGTVDHFVDFHGRVRRLLADLRRERPFQTAVRRFLRATSIALPNCTTYSDDTDDDLLLHYLFAMEALLSSGGGSIGETVSTRAALLTEADETPTVAVRELVRMAYKRRNKIAHGGHSEVEIDLDQLRNTVRRCLIAYLSASTTFSRDDLHKKLDLAQVSPTARQSITAQVQGLLMAAQ